MSSTALSVPGTAQLSTAVHLSTPPPAVFPRYCPVPAGRTRRQPELSHRPQLRVIKRTPRWHKRRRTAVTAALQVAPETVAFREKGQELDEQSSKEESTGVRVTPAGQLLVGGQELFSGVDTGVVSVRGDGDGRGAMIGAGGRRVADRHVFDLGTLRDVRFLACYRSKLWWMTNCSGSRGRQVPSETQFLLLEVKPQKGLTQDPLYAVLLPLLEGSFRACLQGSAEEDRLQMVVESGSSQVQKSRFLSSVYLRYGSDPFAVIQEAVQAVERHLGTFARRQDKQVPRMADWFGWCTWDAFYTKVDPEGVRAGLASLRDAGAPARFVIIDDGWQSVAQDGDTKPRSSPALGFQGGCRVTSVEENAKFRGQDGGLRGFVSDLKATHSVLDVFVWHALAGYWGGVRPGTYGSEIRWPLLSKGTRSYPFDSALHSIQRNGLGAVSLGQVERFYDDQHAYLASAGVDGVKVDVQNILETVGEGLGGRVAAARAFQDSLAASVRKHLPRGSLLACMCHSNDSLWHQSEAALIRASDDFWPRDPSSHAAHVAACAYNSLLLGEIAVPDWDMFHSLHPAAEYHAAARAISGGPIYVSDVPGQHNPEILKRLVLPDGKILRCLLPARPTRDCLFEDCANDGVSLFKVWNHNRYSGVVGVFNNQQPGALLRLVQIGFAALVLPFAPGNAEAHGEVRPSDVEGLRDLAGPGWNGETAIHSHKQGTLVYAGADDAISVTLSHLQYDIFTVVPIHTVALTSHEHVRFAPIGLLNMLNSGGAVQSFHTWTHPSVVRTAGSVDSAEERPGTCPGCLASVVMTVQGCGTLGAYCSKRPERCVVDRRVAAFRYDEAEGRLSLELEAGREHNTHIIEVDFV